MNAEMHINTGLVAGLQRRLSSTPRPYAGGVPAPRPYPAQGR